jgi:hypothetical protein
MSRLIVAGLFLVVAGLALGTSLGPAQAASQTFTITNDSPYDAQVDFESETRVWPGRDQAYTIRSGESRDISLTCTYGEEICYGGWVINHGEYYWGEGPRHNMRCSKCCVNCGHGDVEYTLTR